ncbi:hypothetical protein AMECASPLE_038012 [Ameca splendens]|uniref:Uncharacterized protein n=1 Tax=Ameca splendens TaxID=208324 RepID=A0ABV0YK81_9TELE
MGVFVIKQHREVHKRKENDTWFSKCFYRLESKSCGMVLFRPQSQYLLEPPVAAGPAASLLGYVSTRFSSEFLTIGQAKLRFMESICKHQYLGLVTGLDFDWAILINRV